MAQALTPKQVREKTLNEAAAKVTRTKLDLEERARDVKILTEDLKQAEAELTGAEQRFNQARQAYDKALAL